jgi:hypothetical protein
VLQLNPVATTFVGAIGIAGTPAMLDAIDDTVLLIVVTLYWYEVVDDKPVEE